MQSMNIFLAAVLSAAAAFFTVQWFSARRELSKRSVVERRRDAIDKANRERVSLRRRARIFAARNGWDGDLSVIVIALIFVYAVCVAGLSLVSISGWLAPIIALPTAALSVFWVTSATAQRRRLAFSSQLVQALDLLVAQLHSGASAQLALERIVPNLPDPLRSEFDLALLRKRANMELSDAIAEVAKRYPSRAMDMLVAALRIDEQRGAKMAPALEQAAYTVRHDFELRAEAEAEIAQERMQFFGIVGIIGAIVLFMFTRNSPDQREALTSPAGLTMIGVAAGNFVFGILRVLAMLQKAKEG